METDGMKSMLVTVTLVTNECSIYFYICFIWPKYLNNLYCDYIHYIHYIHIFDSKTI
jgi:hypothetical protein